jgi:hypothetical protein
MLSVRVLRANKSKSCKKAINIYMQDSYLLIKNRKGTHGTNFFLFLLSHEHTHGVWDKQFKPPLSWPLSRQTQLLVHIADGNLRIYVEGSTTQIGILLVYIWSQGSQLLALLVWLQAQERERELYICAYI